MKTYKVIFYLVNYRSYEIVVEAENKEMAKIIGYEKYADYVLENMPDYRVSKEDTVEDLAETFRAEIVEIEDK